MPLSILCPSGTSGTSISAGSSGVAWMYSPRMNRLFVIRNFAMVVSGFSVLAGYLSIRLCPPGPKLAFTVAVGLVPPWVKIQP